MLEPHEIGLAILFVCLSMAFIWMSYRLKAVSEKADEWMAKSRRLELTLEKSIHENITLRMKLSKSLEKGCELVQTLDEVKEILKEDTSSQENKGE